jgi:sugar fermentation stimulation protein A
MRYGKIVHGTFIRRLNRFVAEAEIDGRTETVHVKNTGRLKELLVPGAAVSLEESDNPSRKTRLSLVAVRKGDGWVNIDSQAPNAVLEEALLGGAVGELGRIDALRREAVWGGSRFDFFFESEGKRGYIEVKGVTLDAGGVAMFPDAPTARGARHVLELAEAVKEGHAAVVIFLIQMRGCRLFRPNETTDRAFADALRTAAAGGVKVLAYDARVTDGEITFGDPVAVDLG